MKVPSRLCAALSLAFALVFLACSTSGSGKPDARILLFADRNSQGARELRDAARLAARDAAEEERLPANLEVVQRPLDQSELAAAGSLSGVAAALVLDGSRPIEATAIVRDRYRLATFELAEDIYHLGLLGRTTFQSPLPHSWQAEALARYFGGADRKYRKVGLAREKGAAGKAAAAALSASLSAVGLEFVDAVGEPKEVVDSLNKALPEAVVVEGSRDFLREVIDLLSRGSRIYRGRSRVLDGWRPQIGGFDSLLAVQGLPPAGTVAAGDYARPSRGASRIRRVRQFREAYRKLSGRDPRGGEWTAYESVRAVARAMEESRSHKPDEVLGSLERLQEVTFSHVPITFGPDDHLVSERDFVGLWVVPKDPGEPTDPWTLLMRTFTSDLEHTSIPEQDWPAFFPKVDPRGPAPVYRDARSGVVTGPDDQLH